MATMRPAYGWLTVPLFAACAAGTPQWEKAGAGQSAIDEELQRCRLEAQLSPQPRLQGPTASTSESPFVDRGQERDAQDAQRIGKCMQDKGYSAKR
jgi:hypothetical protein